MEYFIEHCDEISCDPHINAELEVLFVEKGSVSVKYERKIELLGVGDAMLIFPYRLHGFSPRADAKARVLMLTVWQAPSVQPLTLLLNSVHQATIISIN